MIKLYQHPVSPFCIGIRHILEAHKIPHEVVNLAYNDRRPIVERSGGAYYRIPLIEDGDLAVWDKTDLGQEVARYLDDKYQLGLFPNHLDGLQEILSHYIEGEVEGVGFKLNDIDYRDWLEDPYDRAMFVRHKERKFGDGCIERWRESEQELLATFTRLLKPFDAMLRSSAFLIQDRPLFVDFNLYGILGNFMFSGRHRIPEELDALKAWYARMQAL